MRRFLAVNCISVIMFVFSVIMLFVSDGLGLGIACSALWLAYTVIANGYLLTQGKREEKREQDAPLERLKKCDRRGQFSTEVHMLLQQYYSIESRGEYMKSTTDSMQDLYAQILEQARSNMDSAAADKYFRDLWLVSYSLTTLIVTGECPYTDDEISALFTEFSISICKAYKEIPGLPEGEYDKDVVFKELVGK